MKIETGDKRVRKDRRYILVDDVETANSIRDYCMENLMGERWNTVKVYNDRLDPKVEVIFVCTKVAWDRVMEHYDLVKSERYSAGKNRKGLICYVYELNSNK